VFPTNVPLTFAGTGVEVCVGLGVGVFVGLVVGTGGTGKTGTIGALVGGGVQLNNAAIPPANNAIVSGRSFIALDSVFEFFICLPFHKCVLSVHTVFRACYAFVYELFWHIPNIFILFITIVKKPTFKPCILTVLKNIL
jgi:hypothetical protein